jgi:glycosyltransferase involved in cell wall biosynthesis
MPSPPYIVLVPYYSGPDFLRLAVSSVVAQLTDQWACVVVDDSPDGSDVPAIVASFDDARITFVRNETTLGVAANFNRCFDIARERSAELAVILHADDELNVDYIGTMVRVHEANPAACCAVPKATIIDALGRPQRVLADTVKAWLWPNRVASLRGEDGLRRLLHGQFFHCPAVSYRLALLPDPAWDDRWRQVMDLALYADLLLTGGTIVLEPTSQFRYRRHEGQATEANSSLLVRTVEEVELSQIVSARAAQLGWRSAARAGRWRVTVRLQALVRAASFVRGRQWRLAERSIGLALRTRAARAGSIVRMPTGGA